MPTNLNPIEVFEKNIAYLTIKERSKILRKQKLISMKKRRNELKLLKQTNKHQLNLFKNKNGQGLTEYLILVALISVSAIGITRVLGQTVSAQLANVTGALQGRGTDRRINTINRSMYSEKDFSNFSENASSQGR